VQSSTIPIPDQGGDQQAHLRTAQNRAQESDWLTVKANHSQTPESLTEG
jgi:hypothetical protein